MSGGIAWIFASPSDSHVEVLTPKVMILICGVFGRRLGHEGGTPMNGISAFVQ